MKSLRRLFPLLLVLTALPLEATERLEVYAGARQQLTIPLPQREDASLVLEAARPWLRQRVPLSGRATAMVQQGDHLLVAVADRLEVHAATRPLTGRPVATLGLSFAPRFLSVVGASAVLVGRQRFAIVDIADMRRPRLLAEQAIAGGEVVATALDADGRLFLAASDGHLRVVDVSLPESPERVAEVDLGTAVQALAVADGRLFVAAGEAGLAIYDVQDLPDVKRLGGYRTTGPALDLVVASGLVYLASGGQGITILDAHDPGRTSWLGSHQQVGDVRHLRLRGDRLYTLGQGRLAILDVAHPAMPSIVTAVDLAAEARALLPSGEVAYLLTTDALALVDIAVETPEIGNEGLDFGQGVNLGGQRRAAIRDGLLYVADWFSGIHVYDIRGRGRPRLLASLHTPGSPKGIVLDGDHAYVADDDHGLEVVDIADPRHPRLVTRLQTAGLAYTPVVVGQRLYLASHRGGFQIIDISRPEAPRLVSAVDTPGKSWSIRVQGHHAYVADDDNGLLVYDLADERAPRLVARYSPGGDVEDVLIDGDTAYLALFEGGLHVLDIHRPEAPRPIARLRLPGNTRGLERVGRRLYVAGWLAGVHVIDIAEPRRPRLLATYDTPGAAWGVRVDEGRAYVLDWWGGLSVLDVSQAARPRLVARYPDAAARVRRVAAQGDYLFVAYGRAGFQVFDIRNPLNPTWVTGVETGDARDLVLDGGRAYCLDADGDLHVIRIADPFAVAEERRIPLGTEPRQIVALRGYVYLVDGTGRLAVLDPRTATVAPVEGQRDIVDLWQDGRRLVAATSVGEVRIYSLADPARPVVDHRYPVGVGVAQARLLAGRAFVYEAGRGYSPLVAAKAGRPLLGLRARMRDIQGDGRSTLYALDEDGSVLQIDASEAAWRPVARYRPLQPATAMTLYRGVLYLAGGPQIVALRTLASLTVERGTGGVRLGLPAELPLGDYLLRPVGADAASLEPRLLHVRRRPYNKSRLSAEALRRLVAEHRRQRPAAEGAAPAGGGRRNVPHVTDPRPRPR